MKICVYLLIVQFVVHSVVTQQGVYKAAVVEYAPILTNPSPRERILENVHQYINYIEQAADQDVKIIVFPEDGLTGYNDINHNTVDEFSTEVPDPLQLISPCSSQSPNNYSEGFIDLSCSARTHKIYVVVNLIERQIDPRTGGKIYHNTNVVLDKNGSVIARYRKINLFNEDIFVPGNNTVTFETDFGVTFGIFTCFDIMFKNPALDVLSNPAVTDIVYPVGWFSQLPFLEGLSVQHGYATSTGVNLLVAGLDDPSMKNGGSGIFRAGGKIADCYISGAKVSKMLIKDVPKISARDPSGACEISGGASDRSFGLGIGGGIMPDISSFKTSKEDMTNYTFKSVDLDKQVISETICSGESKFCCYFNITVNRDPSTPSNYVYKLTAFHGVRQTSLTKTIGIRNCGLVACLNGSSTSCGERHTLPPTGVTFESIKVKGIFNSKDSHDQPSTLNYDLKPVQDYTFCKRDVNDGVAVSLATTQKQDSLLTFGIYGRVYSNDDKPTGPINRALFHYANVHIVFIVSTVVFLLQD